MSDILADPAVKAMLILLLLTCGGVLTTLLTKWNARLQAIQKTTTETVTLVDGQLSDVKAQLKEMMRKWEAAEEKLSSEKERATHVAVQTAKDVAAQVALQAVKDLAAKDVQFLTQASTPSGAATGGALSVTVPAVTVPVEEATPAAAPSRLVLP